jgi:hypothetical protein
MALRIMHRGNGQDSPTGFTQPICGAYSFLDDFCGEMAFYYLKQT